MNSEIDLIALWAAQIGRRHTSAQSGKTAYEYAVEGGYTGSEEEFAQKLASLMNGSMIGYVNERNEITVTGALAAGATEGSRGTASDDICAPEDPNGAPLIISSKGGIL